MQQKQKGTQHRGYFVVHCVHWNPPSDHAVNNFCRTTPGQTAENARQFAWSVWIWLVALRPATGCACVVNTRTPRLATLHGWRAASSKPQARGFERHPLLRHAAANMSLDGVPTRDIVSLSRKVWEATLKHCFSMTSSADTFAALQRCCAALLPRIWPAPYKELYPHPLVYGSTSLPQSLGPVCLVGRVRWAMLVGLAEGICPARGVDIGHEPLCYVACAGLLLDMLVPGGAGPWSAKQPVDEEASGREVAAAEIAGVLLHPDVCWPKRTLLSAIYERRCVYLRAKGQSTDDRVVKYLKQARDVVPLHACTRALYEPLVGETREVMNDLHEACDGALSPDNQTRCDAMGRVELCVVEALGSWVLADLRAGGLVPAVDCRAAVLAALWQSSTAPDEMQCGDPTTQAALLQLIGTRAEWGVLCTCWCPWLGPPTCARCVGTDACHGAVLKQFITETWDVWRSWRLC